MIDVDRAILDPSDVFNSPEEVAENKELTMAQKIKILRQWEYDEQEVSVAEDENMAGGNGNDTLDRIHHLLLLLTTEQDKNP